MNRRLPLAATLALAVSGAALAADPAPAAPPAETPAAAPVEKPSADCVKSFWNFYFNGKGQGLVLAEAKLCLEVAKDGPNKSECIKEVPAEGVKPGTMINVWQAYLVPNGDTIEDMSIQLKLGDQIRETKDVKVNGASIRWRSWNAFRIPKAGTWTINILRGSETLKSLQLTAK
ncbi:MAG TPA: hypothetical protein VFT91_04225 [Dehalococcoidia bacterium]|nr:hypothetical protein [Dehalococcoidia bacterium]